MTRYPILLPLLHKLLLATLLPDLALANALPAAPAGPSWQAFATRQFTRYDTTRGLPVNAASALTQDARGYLWVGTGAGLARWDGQRFDVVAPSPDGLPDGYVRALLALGDGALLVGTNAAGLLRFDPATGAFTRIPLGAPGQLAAKVFALRQVGPQAVWVASDLGLGRLDLASGQVTPIPLDGLPPASRVFDALEDPQGRLWIGTQRGLWRREAGAAAFHPVEDPNGIASDLVWRIHRDTGGRLWIGSDSRGVLVIEPDGRAWSPAALHGATALTHGNTVRDFIADAAGQLWISTYGGGVIACADADCNVATALRTRHGDAHSLASNIVRHSLITHDGTLWFATINGLSSLPLSDGAITLVEGQQVRINVGSTPSVSAVLPDRRGRVWVAMRATGIGVFDLVAGREHWLKGADSQEGQSVTGFTETPDGTLWAGGLGVTGFNPDTLQPRRTIPGLAGQRVTALTSDANDLLVGTYNTTWRYAPAQGTLLPFQPISQPPPHEVRDFLHVGARLWLGTANGLASLGPQPGATLSWARMGDTRGGVLPHNYVYQTAATSRPARLWVATDGGLVWAEGGHDAAAAKFHPLLLDGQPLQAIALVTDRDGQLWAAAGGRLYRIDNTDFSVRVFTHLDGLPESAFAAGNAVRGPGDQLLFGTIDGLVVVDTGKLLTHRPLDAPLQLGSLRVADQAGQHRLLTGDTVELGADQRDFSLDFSLLSYHAPHEIRYRYRLASLDKNWREVAPGTLASAVYTGLPAGHYRLDIEAWVSGDKATVVRRSFPLGVAPHWHETGIAHALAAFGLLLLAALLVRSGQFWSRHHQRALDQLIARRTHELNEANARLTKLATTDVLTGLLTRRAFMEQATQAFNAARRQGLPLSIALLDLDYFKRVNDTYGHLAGDAVLHASAQAILAGSRQHDPVGRYGGEEIIVCMPDTTGHSALELAERLRRSIAGLVITHESQTLTITCSIGVASLTPTDANLGALLQRTDAALYAAKHAGRDRVAFAPP